MSDWHTTLYESALHVVCTACGLSKRSKLKASFILGCRPKACYGAPKVAATTVTHASLTQVLQQLDHLQPLTAKTT